MNGVFLEQLELPEPRYNLHVGSGSHAEETGKMLIGIEKVLKSEAPDVVLVEGDTNTVLAGALAAAKLHVKVGHVEAGLRSRDMEMPEEVNRIMTDHISDFLFAPTHESKKNLIGEGIDQSRIHVTGNTIVDAVRQNLALAENLHAFDTVDSNMGEYVVATIHRQENADNEERLRAISEGLHGVSVQVGLPVALFAHPRTRGRLKAFGIKVGRGVKMLKPADYLSFLKFEAGARLILTDSGGIQEEACILKVPCVTIRESTERPETIAAGANVVAGRNPDGIVSAAEEMIKRKRNWANPYGDGSSGQRIVDFVLKHG